jgi:hypothetical protein
VFFKSSCKSYFESILTTEKQAFNFTATKLSPLNYHHNKPQQSKVKLMTIIKLHRHALSSHSHRVQLLLSVSGLDADIIDIDLGSGEHKRSAFLQKNRFGQLPVLEDGDTVLSDFNAILFVLGRNMMLAING